MATTKTKADADESSETMRPPLLMTNSARFALGQVIATPGALTLLTDTGFSAIALLARHLHGDWGDIDAEDSESNDRAVEQGHRLLSAYRLVNAERLTHTPQHRRGDLPTLWIITEADRSVTTLLRPQDY